MSGWLNGLRHSEDLAHLELGGRREPVVWHHLSPDSSSMNRNICTKGRLPTKVYEWLGDREELNPP